MQIKENCVGSYMDIIAYMNTCALPESYVTNLMYYFKCYYKCD